MRLQPQRLMIAQAGVGCKPMFGGLSSLRDHVLFRRLPPEVWPSVEL